MTNKNKAKITVPDTPGQITAGHIDFVAEEVMGLTKGQAVWLKDGKSTGYFIAEEKHLENESLRHNHFMPFHDLRYAWDVLNQVDRNGIEPYFLDFPMKHYANDSKEETAFRMTRSIMFDMLLALKEKEEN
ncbi:MAG: hypothetical protein GY940_36115, partial [bacterium]|nr:hypothetical protein [bacterium]